MYPLARIFFIIGLLMILIGGLIYLIGRIGLPLGRLPGDIRIQGENITCLFPLATMIVLSVVLTLLLNIIVRLLNR
jgi:hypothetical protein